MVDSADVAKRATGLPFGLARAQFSPDSCFPEGSTTKGIEEEVAEGSLGSLGGEDFESEDEEEEELKQAEVRESCGRLYKGRLMGTEMESGIMVEMAAMRTIAEKLKIFERGAYATELRVSFSGS